MEKEMIKPEVGDSIKAQDYTFEIAKITYCEYNGEQYGWYVEFRDPADGYHYWKQGPDGGEIIKAKKQEKNNMKEERRTMVEMAKQMSKEEFLLTILDIAREKVCYLDAKKELTRVKLWFTRVKDPYDAKAKAAGEPASMMYDWIKISYRAKKDGVPSGDTMWLHKQRLVTFAEGWYDAVHNCSDVACFDLTIIGHAKYVAIK